MGAVLALAGVGLALDSVMGSTCGPEFAVDLARMRLLDIKLSLAGFKLKFDRYPTTSEGLAALVSPPSLPNGRIPAPLVDNPDLFLDPWGTPFAYFSPSRDGQEPYEVVSYGDDGEVGGDGLAADISTQPPPEEVPR